MTICAFATIFLALDLMVSFSFEASSSFNSSFLITIS